MVSMRTIRRLKTQAGFRRGEDHPHAKLTDNEVEQIRQLHDDGMGYLRIARKFDVAKGTVADICKYRRR